VFHNISSSTLYGMTNPVTDVTEVTNLVTDEESLTLKTGALDARESNEKNESQSKTMISG